MAHEYKQQDKSSGRDIIFWLIRKGELIELQKLQGKGYVPTLQKKEKQKQNIVCNSEQPEMQISL